MVYIAKKCERKIL